MRKSLKSKLLDLILSKGYVSYGEMAQFTVEEGYKVETSSRRLRELKEDGKIECETKTSRRHTPYISGYLRLGVTPPKPRMEIVEENGMRIARQVV